MIKFQGAPLEEFVKTSVKQTVEHNYNDNNTAAMKTFDMIQEGVGWPSLGVYPQTMYHVTIAAGMLRQ